MIKTRRSVDTYSVYGNTGPVPIPRASTVINTNDLMQTFNHDLSQLGKSDCGGPWSLQYFRVKRSKTTVAPWFHPTQQRWYGGEFCSPIAADSAEPSVFSRQTELDAQILEARGKAPQAIALSNPVHPEVDLATALGELYGDGLPSMAGHTLWKERTRIARGAGGEYLNAQFGWLPLVSDLKKFAKTVRDSNNIVEQFERGSGVRQKRAFHWPDVESSLQGKSVTTSMFPADTQTWGTSTLSYSEVTTKSMWFSGAFKYYVPKSGLARYTALANKLYGARLTPDVVWNLAPWSWALDWFGNTGDVLANISQLGPDASVMEWGYMMTGRSTVRDIWGAIKGTSHPANPVRDQLIPVSTTVLSGSKVRVVGSPYTFSANLPVLTPRQIAILAALGLSRSPR